MYKHKRYGDQAKKEETANEDKQQIAEKDEFKKEVKDF